MTDAAQYLQLFAPMLWLGMVLAISFLEAPLKFRAPGITVPLGLGIGRIVFRALNTVESLIAAVLVVACLAANPGTTEWVLLAVTVAVLAVQLLAVRPPLTKRSNRILAGEDAPRSRLHFVYIALEVLKVGLLVALAIGLAPAL